MPAKPDIVDNTGFVNDVNGRRAKRTLLLQKIFLFLLAFIVYANSIPNDFNLDDELYHTRAQKLAAMGTHGLAASFTDRTFIEGDNKYQYRPLTLLSFVAQYELVGDSPHASHLINVLLYAFTCFLLFNLLLSWFGEGRNWLAFFIALLFVLHPLHTEVVDSIKNRDELLATLFGILSFILAWKALTRPWYIVPAAFVFLLALLCKLTIFLALPVIPLAYFFLARASLKKIVLYTLIFFAAAPAYRLITMHLPAVHRTFYEHENPLYTGSLGFLTRSATAFSIMGRYLTLHLFPYRLVYYYGSNYVPFVSWANIWALLSVAIYAFIIVVIIKQFRKRSILAFGLALFVLSTFLYSNLLRAVPGLMAERFVYLASLGFCVALCTVLYDLLRIPLNNNTWNSMQAKQLLACILIIALLYAGRTIARNNDWRDKYTLYTHDMPYLTSSSKANLLHGDLFLNLASRYRTTAAQLRQQQNMGFAKVYADSAAYFNNIAIENFKQALAVTPHLPSAMSDLAMAYFTADSQLLARKYFREALTIRPNDAKLNSNLGVLYFKASMPDSAIYLIKRAIASDTSFAAAYQTLCDVQLSQRDTAAAISTLQSATRNIANPIAAYVDLGDIALHQKDTLAAVQYFEKAAPMKPGSLFALSFLTQYYQAVNNMERARYYYNMLVQLQAERNGSK